MNLSCIFNLKNTLIVILLFFKFSFRVHSQTPADFIENVGLESVLAVNNRHDFSISLPYDQSFYGTVTQPSLPHRVPHCKYYPSSIQNVRSIAVGGIDTVWSNAGGPNDLQIKVSMGYYFYSRSSQFGLFVSGKIITLDAALTAVIGATPVDNVFMVLDTTNQIIYQINNNFAFSYDVPLFHADLLAQNPVPEISINGFSAGFSFSTINTVKFYQNKIYIVTDDEVYIYQCSTAGTLTLFGKYDSTTFGASPVDLVDIAFKGNYAFILDNVMGVFTIDTTAPTPPNPSWRIDRKRGRFIEIAGSSLLIISDTTSLIYEYFLVDPLPEVVFNQYFKLFHSNLKIRKVASDITYLAITTDDMSLVIRHSIPARFYDSNMQMQLECEIHVARAIKANSASVDGTSEFLTLNRDFSLLYLNKIVANQPSIWCQAYDLPGCKYLFEVQGVQGTCPSKLASASPNDPQTVCFKDQQVEIIVLNSDVACPDTTIAAPLGLKKTENTVIEQLPNVVSRSKRQRSSLEDLTKTQHLEDNVENFVQEKSEVKPSTEKRNFVTYDPPVRAPRNRTLNRTRETINPFDNRARRTNVSRDDFNQNIAQRRSNDILETPSISNAQGKNGSRKATESVSRAHSSSGNPELHSKVPMPDPEVDKKQAEVEDMMVMINENNKVMNTLVISVIVLFVIIALLGSFIAFKFRKGNKKEEENEEEEAEEIVTAENSEKRNNERKREKISKKTIEMSTTFGDESKIKIDMDLSKIEVNN